MAYVIADLQAFLANSARNGNDPISYTPTRQDIAIQAAMRKWSRITRTPRQLDTVAITAGSATLPAFPTGFLPEFNLETYLSLSGKIIYPEITFTSIQDVLAEQVNGAPLTTTLISEPPTNPRTGRPTKIAFADTSHAFLDTLPDQAYTLNVWWRCPLTLWTPGSSGPTFNLPDEALLSIATLGAVYFLQKGEPANAAQAKEAYAEFIQEAGEFRGRNAGGKGAQVMQRDNPVRGDGSWARPGRRG